MKTRQSALPLALPKVPDDGGRFPPRGVDFRFRVFGWSRVCGGVVPAHKRGVAFGCESQGGGEGGEQ